MAAEERGDGHLSAHAHERLERRGPHHRGIPDHGIHAIALEDARREPHAHAGLRRRFDRRHDVERDAVARHLGHAGLEHPALPVEHVDGRARRQPQHAGEVTRLVLHERARSAREIELGHLESRPHR